MAWLTTNSRHGQRRGRPRVQRPGGSPRAWSPRGCHWQPPTAVEAIAPGSVARIQQPLFNRFQRAPGHSLPYGQEEAIRGQLTQAQLTQGFRNSPQRLLGRQIRRYSTLRDLDLLHAAEGRPVFDQSDRQRDRRRQLRERGRWAAPRVLDLPAGSPVPSRPTIPGSRD